MNLRVVTLGRLCASTYVAVPSVPGCDVSEQGSLCHEWEFREQVRTDGNS